MQCCTVFLKEDAMALLEAGLPYFPCAYLLTVPHACMPRAFRESGESERLRWQNRWLQRHIVLDPQDHSVEAQSFNAAEYEVMSALIKGAGVVIGNVALRRYADSGR
jgi:hypothetical protein